MKRDPLRINLRALTESDILKTCAWHNDKNIKDYYAGHPFPVNIEMEKRWYDKILTENFPSTVFGIEVLPAKELIGLVTLKDINLINRNCELSIYIGEMANRGKGYATEATREALSFAFLKLGLHRVWLRVMDGNENAVKMYERLGFKKEGTHSQSLYRDGSFRDEHIYALLREEWHD